MKRLVLAAVAALFLVAAPVMAGTFAQTDAWSCSVQGGAQSGQQFVGSLDAGQSVTVSHAFEACNAPGITVMLQVTTKDAKNVSLAVTDPAGNPVGPILASKGSNGDYFLSVCADGSIGTYAVTVAATKAVASAGLEIVSGQKWIPC